MMQNTKKPIVTINLTPLVDVSLVLVVIFMATAPMFLQSGIIVTSSEKKMTTEIKQKKKSEKSKNIVIKLAADKLWLNQHQVTEEELPALLKRMLVESENRRVVVNPDRDVKHGMVIRIMDLAKQSGAGNLIILGKSKKKTGERK
ncbi:biopolymer transporter ExbD [bacterium]|nr:biopolymer transporter ExbD [bacterium]